jgi:anaerobic selenocysteine-containing dehydrogenase
VLWIGGNAETPEACLNKPIRAEILTSVCPHDCPSACSLEVERLDDRTIRRIRGASEQSYTAGVICAKVARYAERIHHPDRLTRPLRRAGPKGSGRIRRTRAAPASIR